MTVIEVRCPAMRPVGPDDFACGAPVGVETDLNDATPDDWSDIVLTVPETCADGCCLTDPALVKDVEQQVYDQLGIVLAERDMDRAELFNDR